MRHEDDLGTKHLLSIFHRFCAHFGVEKILLRPIALFITLFFSCIFHRIQTREIRCQRCFPSISISYLENQTWGKGYTVVTIIHRAFVKVLSLSRSYLFWLQIKIHVLNLRCQFCNTLSLITLKSCLVVKSL